MNVPDTGHLSRSDSTASTDRRTHGTWSQSPLATALAEPADDWIADLTSARFDQVRIEPLRDVQPPGIDARIDRILERLHG